MAGALGPRPALPLVLLVLHHAADQLDVFLELELAVMVGVEGRHHRRLGAGLLHQLEVGELVLLERAALVGVHGYEVGVQLADGLAHLDLGPASAELLDRQGLVLVLVPGVEHAFRRGPGLLRGMGVCRRGRLGGGLRHGDAGTGDGNGGDEDGGDQLVAMDHGVTSSFFCSCSKVIRSLISGVRRPTIIGLRTFGRNAMSKISEMSPSKRIQCSTSPLVNEVIWTPHHGSTSRLVSSSSSWRPSKRLLRGFDRPTAAMFPTIDRPRRKPGMKASGTKLLFLKSTQPMWPVPALSTHSLPFAQRGECGIDRPSHTISLVSMSMTTPPDMRRSRQPSTASLLHTAVTYFGSPSTMARPFRWHRSSGASLLMKSGFQIGLKLCVWLSSAMQLYL